MSFKSYLYSFGASAICFFLGVITDMDSTAVAWLSVIALIATALYCQKKEKEKQEKKENLPYKPKIDSMTQRYINALNQLDDGLLRKVGRTFSQLYSSLDEKQTNNDKIIHFVDALIEVDNMRKNKKQNIKSNQRIINIVDVVVDRWKQLIKDGNKPLIEAENHGLDFGIITNRATNVLAYGTADAWERASNVSKAARETQTTIVVTIEELVDSIYKYPPLILTDQEDRKE